MQSHGDSFRTTRWSLIHQAAQGSAVALEQICTAYWSPVCSFLLRTGHPEASAKDITQKFFYSKVLREGWLATADLNKGQFRSFILQCLNRFVKDEWRREQALKRGGGQPNLQLEEALVAQEIYPDFSLTCDKEWDADWARGIVDNAIKRLRDEYNLAGNGLHFERLAPLVLNPNVSPADRDRAYAEIAREFGASVKTVGKTWIHRFRQRLRECLRREVARTLGSGEDIENEIRHLFEVLRGS